MRPNSVVVVEPLVGRGSKFRQRSEQMEVEELIADATVERFDPGVLCGLPGLDEDQLDIVNGGPFEHCQNGSVPGRCRHAGDQGNRAPWQLR